MKYLPIAFILTLTSCASIVSENPKQITIFTPAYEQGKAQSMADMHCGLYHKHAIPVGVMFGNNVTFVCQ